MRSVWTAECEVLVRCLEGGGMLTEGREGGPGDAAWESVAPAQPMETAMHQGQQ